MASRQKTKRVIVPDALYSFLFINRYNNDNCKASQVVKDVDDVSKVKYHCLDIDTGIERLHIFPESNCAPEYWYQE